MLDAIDPCDVFSSLLEGEAPEPIALVQLLGDDLRELLVQRLAEEQVDRLKGLKSSRYKASYIHYIYHIIFTIYRSYIYCVCT